MVATQGYAHMDGPSEGIIAFVRSLPVHGLLDGRIHGLGKIQVHVVMVVVNALCRETERK